jgi:spore maturation protein CgeB
MSSCDAGCSNVPRQDSSGRGGIKIVIGPTAINQRRALRKSVPRQVVAISENDHGASTALTQRDLVIIGNVGGSHIGESLTRGAGLHGINVVQVNSGDAYTGPAWVRRLLWYVLDHRPPKMRSFQRQIATATQSSSNGLVITTGLTPITSTTLIGLKQRGCTCLHYSTDDPWNPAMHAPWFIKTLPLYDKVFTPRLSTIPDLEALPCKNVVYLPFGYDPELFFPEEENVSEAPLKKADVLFVGGADRDRVPIIEKLTEAGLRLALYGGYWERYPDLKASHLGTALPATIRRATSKAAINLCLVRRANRDGHVMRSFEIPAIGGFMLAEDTQEHRDIFGPEEQCVLYFASPTEAIEKARWALNNPLERRRMAKAAHERIVTGKNTYKDRLEQMLTAA